MLPLTLRQVELLLEYRWLVANGIRLSPGRAEEFDRLARSAGRPSTDEGVRFPVAAWQVAAAKAGCAGRGAPPTEPAAGPLRDEKPERSQDADRHAEVVP